MNSNLMGFGGINKYLTSTRTSPSSSELYEHKKRNDSTTKVTYKEHWGRDLNLQKEIDSELNLKI